MTMIITKNIDVDNIPINPNNTMLFFDYMFDKEIDLLPCCVETIIFSNISIFSGYLNNLPNSLKKLYIGENYRQTISCLPHSLMVLHIRSPYINIKDLPDNLVELSLHTYIDSFPTNLKKLYLWGEWYNPSVYYNLPKNIKVLRVNTKFDCDLDILPDSIEELFLNMSYNIEIKKVPSNLKTIHVYHRYIHIKEVKNIKNININEYI